MPVVVPDAAEEGGCGDGEVEGEVAEWGALFFGGEVGEEVVGEAGAGGGAEVVERGGVEGQVEG